ncbi:hypothetical protein like AT3G47570 [Hibiscus trionum]|uniref:Leucine-rich repeat-containing N-terminal plant-type domain-containing protein n=1 Tax=Hibiscus trionum TaxID=183268 RepID=A0A9W7MN52_HIBTR|nr:hypothetical protein like AT3G47570 [Hibiscus trionum]
MISKLLCCALFLFSILCKLDHVESATPTSMSANQTEIQVLLAFKARILADPYGVFTSWNDSQHFCNWPGVTCGPRHQRVTSLNLSSLKLAGDLSPYIANLTFLRVIDLRNNNFGGPIPQEATRLHRLERLILANNSFQGELPRNLTCWSNLKAIDVNSNRLRGKINAELSSLSRLQLLQLAFNNFIGTIPPSLGNISSLLYLSLKQNHLQGNIPSELGQLSKLKFLQLSLNNLSGTVPEKLYNISSIYLFSLAENQLQGQIPPYIGFSLPNLESIYLGVNKFSGPIPTSIVNSSGLVNLDMALNALSGPIPKNLGSLQSLQFLNFGWNFLESSNDLSFFTSLTNCTNLSTLVLAQNNLTGVLPDSIGNLSANLFMLRIETNYISGTIPKEIENLLGLEFLGLQKNRLTGKQSTTEQSSSMGIRGTIGYIPQEYGMGKEISTHGDVYSYGIVLMELFTGKRPTDRMFAGDLSLREYVKTAMPEIVETWLSFEDEAAVNQNGQSSKRIGNIPKFLGSVLSIGVSCSVDSPGERMNIKDVLRELYKARNLLL